MSKVLDRIQHSFWIKVISGAVFIALLYGNNALEIAKVDAKAQNTVAVEKAEALRYVSETYVTNKVFDLVKEDIGEIKDDMKAIKQFILKDR